MPLVLTTGCPGTGATSLPEGAGVAGGTYMLGGTGAYGREKALEPIARQAGRRFQGPRLLEEMGGARDEGQFLFAP